MSNEPQDSSVENVSEEVIQDEALETIIDEGIDESKADSSDDLSAEEFSLLKEQALRAKAETQNTRRRAEQDVEKARKFALEKFVNDLLPVVDNLERAIEAGDKNNESQNAVLEGVELTLKSLVDTLKKYNVETINPENEPFDPQFHQAMSMAPSPDVEPNTVLNVFQKGYALNGRLVRPAMVVVSTAP